MRILSEGQGQHQPRTEPKEKIRYSTATLRSLSIQLANKGFSPKISAQNIPEFVTLLEMAILLLAQIPRQAVIKKRLCKKVRDKYMKMGAIRKRLSKVGLRAQPGGSKKRQHVGNLSKAKILRMLLSHRNGNIT